MGKKNKRVFYSTDKTHDYSFEDEDDQDDAPTNPDKQNLRVLIDRKNRRGKEATLVTGYKGNPQVLEELGKMLKKKCGVGGAVKNNEIIIQGNHREKVVDILIKEGYTNTKKSGG